MNIQTEKLRLIEWISKVQDSKIIEKLISIRKENIPDWWDEISDNEKNEIELGLKDIDQGKIHEHSEVKKLYEKHL